jgi:signal peptidase II
MHPLETVELVLFFKLQYVRNRGIAFGLFEGYGSIIVLAVMVIVLLMLIATLFIRKDGDTVWPLALLLAGSCGNLIDRVWLGSVTDFIRVPYWPAFNLADIFIVLGVLLLVRALWLRGVTDSGT